MKKEIKIALGIIVVAVIILMIAGAEKKREEQEIYVQKLLERHNIPFDSTESQKMEGYWGYRHLNGYGYSPGVHVSRDLDVTAYILTENVAWRVRVNGQGKPIYLEPNVRGKTNHVTFPGDIGFIQFGIAPGEKIKRATVKYVLVPKGQAEDKEPNVDTESSVVKRK